MAGLEKVVTDELVAATADRLMLEGGKVTNRLIWTEIGGGSMTTIANALRRWRDAQATKVEAPVERAPLPSAVADALHDATLRLWQVAQAETQKEVEAQKKLADELVAAAEVERDAALNELETELEARNELAAELADSKALAGDLDAQLGIEQANAQRHEVELAGFKEKLVAAESATKQAADAHAAELAGLQKQFDELMVKFDQVQQKNTVAGQEQAVLSSKLEAALAGAVLADKNLATANQELASAKLHIQSQQIALDACARQSDEAKREVKEVRAEARKAQDEAAELRGELRAVHASTAPDNKPEGGAKK